MGNSLAGKNYINTFRTNTFLKTAVWILNPYFGCKKGSNYIDLILFKSFFFLFSSHP